MKNNTKEKKCTGEEKNDDKGSPTRKKETAKQEGATHEERTGEDDKNERGSPTREKETAQQEAAHAKRDRDSKKPENISNDAPCMIFKCFTC